MPFQVRLLVLPNPQNVASRDFTWLGLPKITHFRPALYLAEQVLEAISLLARMCYQQLPYLARHHHHYPVSSGVVTATILVSVVAIIVIIIRVDARMPTVLANALTDIVRRHL
jgi:hypothetical protein